MRTTVALIWFFGQASLAATVFSADLVSYNGLYGYRTVNELQTSVARANSNNDYFVECAPLAELNATVLCIFASQIQMNRTFTRMGIFWGSSTDFAPETLVHDDNLELRKLERIIVGHNLPGTVLASFMKTAQLNPFESEFLTAFAKQPCFASTENNCYLIAASINSPVPTRKAIDHEIRHARYYLDKSWKNRTVRFWKEQVSSDDKSDIRRLLETVYNVSSDEVTIDEFQAYLLQEDAEHAMLSRFVRKYREGLNAALAEH